MSRDDQLTFQPPIQNLTAFDILGARHGGGVDAAIIAATPIDGSTETLAALATKIRNYTIELASSEFLAEYPHESGKIRIILTHTARLTLRRLRLPGYLEVFSWEQKLIGMFRWAGIWSGRSDL